MRLLPVAAAIVPLLLITAPARCGQQEAVFSGPQAGEKLPPLNVRLAYGDHRGRQVDLVEAAGGKTTLLVLVSDANRPAARLTRVLMHYAEMRSREQLFAAVVWLDGDISAAETYLQQAVSWWEVGMPVGISLDGAEGPGSYGLNRNVNVTVLVAQKGRVTANFAIVQPSEQDAQKILVEVVKLIGGEAPTEPECVFLSLPSRKPPAAPWHTAPQDVRLRELVCAVLAAENSSAAAEAAGAVDRYIAEHKERSTSLGRTAKALSQGRTKIVRSPAVKHLRRWAQQYGQE